MTTMVVLLWAAVLVNLVLLLRLTRQVRLLVDASAEPPLIPGLAVDEAAPAFDAETIEGDRVSTADYANRGLTVIYLSHQCPSCRSHMPSLAGIYALAQRAGSDVVVAVFDDTSETRSATATAVAEFAIPAKVVIVDTDHPLQRVYNPNRASPFFYEIDRGTVRAKGGVGSEDWQAVLRKWQTAADEEREELARFA